MLPTLSEFVAGLQNDPHHLKGFLRLTKILLQLVLEYPGLPSGIAGRTPLEQAYKDVGLHRENYSELLRMFLTSRDDEGKKVNAKCHNSGRTCILRIICRQLLKLGSTVTVISPLTIFCDGASNPKAPPYLQPPVPRTRAQCPLIANPSVTSSVPCRSPVKTPEKIFRRLHMAPVERD
ncbi:unnamed protein product [Gongylonema pulchrum]|uniref:Uncharacterized protein n=1 Tax=Gongylonema pulchrum TaxID=637853 RepID=A0A183DL39_9BILA|nr:unnamed protein product [Gongylonema pulchrum]